MVKKVLWYLIFSLCFIIISCNNQTELEKAYNTSTPTSFKLTKKTLDVHKEFSINLGQDWKTELYFDHFQSRIYSADTTRAFSESYLIDITKFKGEIILSKAFQNKLKKQITDLPRSYIIHDHTLKFKEKEAYTIFSFQRKDNVDVYSIQLYILDHQYYYLLESKIYGDAYLNQNIAESLAVFESINFDL